MDFAFLDERPIIVAIAGSNGAGKTTFYHSHLADTGLRFINADDLANELEVDPFAAAELAAALRVALVERRESFIFETVFSDPVGQKVQFLHDAAALGYQVVLIFIRIPDADTSTQRVSMRVAQGGHDIPDTKLYSRFQRTLNNLQRAIEHLPYVLVYDNADLSHPFRLVEVWHDGELFHH
jgi:predicted ABC-type ATPase